MSTSNFIADMRNYGIELTPSEVKTAAKKSLGLRCPSEITELGQVCIFFGEIGKAREAEGLDVSKFELLIDLCTFILEEE